MYLKGVAYSSLVVVLLHALNVLWAWVGTVAEKNPAESDHPSGSILSMSPGKLGAQHKENRTHQTKQDVYSQSLLREREALLCEEADHR